MLKLLTVMLARTCPKATLVIKIICNRPSALCRSIIICDAISDVSKRIMQFFGGVNNTPVFLPLIFIPALLLAESIVFDIQYCCKTHAVVFIPFLVIRKGNLTSEILIFIFFSFNILHLRCILRLKPCSHGPLLPDVAKCMESFVLKVAVRASHIILCD